MICVDINSNLHLNNQVQFKNLEDGRQDFFIKLGAIKFCRKEKCHGAAIAINVRFRRELFFTQNYQVRTRLAWWDDKNLYLEQRLVSEKTVSQKSKVKVNLFLKKFFFSEFCEYNCLCCCNIY